MFVYHPRVLRSFRHSRRLIASLIIGCMLAAQASDHSDAPQANGIVRQDANLTDLHAFVKGHNLVISLCANPAIPKSAAAYQFPSDVTYEINLDNHCPVADDDPNGLGGTIMDPARVQADITFRVTFGESGPRVKTLMHRGGAKAPITNFFAGLRDDPFIRGPRQGRNIAAIVLEVPLADIATTQSTLLIWATSKVDDLDGRFQDLAGRSLRSMMPENADMNDMAPRQQNVRMGVAPDVMIFNTARAAAFPNGRALTDDVVDLVGDPRVLGSDAPFPAANDLPFLDVFPYLAPPHAPQ
jgi:hypothetical protein